MPLRNERGNVQAVFMFATGDYTRGFHREQWSRTSIAIEDLPLLTLRVDGESSRCIHRELKNLLDFWRAFVLLHPQKR